MKTHSLKCHPEYYRPIRLGYKRFEMRWNDRDFENGDILQLREWEPAKKEYTGEEISVRVTHIMHGPQFGLKEGWTCMSVMIL